MGSSGGGGSSGAVSHSPYLENIHTNWLSKSGVDTIEKSITEVMDSALGSSPWIGLTAYNPATPLAANAAAIAAFAVILAGLSDTVNWAALYAQANTTLAGVGEAEIVADVDAFSDILDDGINTKVLPRFRRGMQDINAVSSSAFVLGEAVIEGFRDRDVAKYMSALRITVNDRKLKAVEQMIGLMTNRINWEADYVRMAVETNRIKIVALKEQTDQDAIIDESDAKWDLEVFQCGANLLAAIGGGTAIPNMPGKNRAASAIGGAMTGTAAGAMLAVPTGGISVAVGAVIGGVLGLGAGLM